MRQFDFGVRVKLFVALMLVASAGSGLAAVRYVDVNSASPTPPYTNWATAAATIQGAVDAAMAGDEILVTNGVYATGGRTTVSDSTTNRVVVDKPLVLRSVAGPQFAIINGGQLARCVRLANGASLSGFSLTNGSARFSMAGGVWCDTNVVVSNCVVSGNSDGGVFGGTLNDCLIIGNKGSSVLHDDQSFGGGANGSTLNNCILSGNSAGFGAGALRSTLNNCILTGNIALSSQLSGSGGGAANCTLNDCTLTGNRALPDASGRWGGQGGGTVTCTLNNCIVYFNTADRGALTAGEGDNYDSSSTLNYSCTTPQPTNGFGNITDAPLFVDQASGNLRLQSNSPCINAGNNSYVTNATDLDGNPRIAGVTVDMGAYEFQSPPQLTITLSGAYVILTWPTNVAGFDYAGFTLQSTINLVSPAVWTTVFPGPVDIAGQNTVINPISGTQMFYRLRQQTEGCRSNLDCPPGYRCIIPTGQTVGSCQCVIAICDPGGF